MILFTKETNKQKKERKKERKQENKNKNKMEAFWWYHCSRGIQ
jgi:hypothetical protein